MLRDLLKKTFAPNLYADYEVKFNIKGHFTSDKVTYVVNASSAEDAQDKAREKVKEDLFSGFDIVRFFDNPEILIESVKAVTPIEKENENLDAQWGNY